MRECYEIRIHAYIKNSDTGQHTIHAQHVPSSSPSLNCLYIKYNDACIMPKNYELRVYAYFFCCCCFVFRFGFGSCCAEAVYMRFANELSIFFSVVFRYWRLERSASIIYWRVHVYAYRCVCTMSKLYNFASMFVIFCFSSLAFIRMLRSISFCRNYFAQRTISMANDQINESSKREKKNNLMKNDSNEKKRGWQQWKKLNDWTLNCFISLKLQFQSECSSSIWINRF